MKHLSLAARYRPQSFAEVAGQDMVKNILSRTAAEDKPAAAYLLSGTRGVGKTTVARIFAKALNCEHAPAAEPCNQCDQCRKITQGIHVDVTEIDGASNNGVDDVRALRETVGFAPMEARYKIFIVDEAHMLSRSAFNALLKTLEEPPKGVVFLFATTEIHKFPPTILSRCQQFVFRHLSEDALMAHMANILQKEQITYEDSALRLVARRAAGSVRDSLSLLDQTLALGEKNLTAEVTRQVLGLAGQEFFTEMFDAMHRQDCAAIVRLCRQLLANGIDIGFFVRELISHLRTLFLLVQGGAAIVPSLDLTKDEAAQWQAIAPQFTASHLHAAWQMALDAQYDIVHSLEPAAALELLLFNIALLPRLLPVAHIHAQGTAQTPQSAPAATGSQQPVPAVLPQKKSTSNTVTPPTQMTQLTQPVGHEGAQQAAAAAKANTPVANGYKTNASGASASGTNAPGARTPGTSNSGAQPTATATTTASGTATDNTGENGTTTASSANDKAAEPPQAKSEGAPDWPAFCDFCEELRQSQLPELPARLLRTATATWTDDALRIAPADNFSYSELDRQRNAIATALRAYDQRARQIVIVPPPPRRTRSELLEEFGKRPEIAICQEVLGARLTDCKPVPQKQTHCVNQGDPHA